jgi:DNA repair protein RecO (recombination protein O)
MASIGHGARHAAAGAERGHPDRLQRCFLLHRRDYSDTSLLLEVFSADHGRLPIIARGAKRGRSPTASVLQPFIPLLMSWRGRGEVFTLARAEAAGRPLALRGDALYCGFYVNELLIRLLGRQDPHEALFVYYQIVLEALAAGDELESPLRQFELRLLGELGYEVVLDRAGNSDILIDRDAYYVYSPEGGLTVALSATTPGAIRGETLRLLADAAPLPAANAREARTFMRRLLAPHLGERPLKSRALFAARRTRPP